MKKIHGIILLLAFIIGPHSFTQAARQVGDVRVHTNVGVFEITLEPRKAPITVENFLYYVDKGFYDNTLFHRVIYKFMIQGGGYTVDSKKKEPIRRPIRNESDNGLKNTMGAVAMARTDNPDSATTQFFINLVDNKHLDYANGKYGYAVFGRVTYGMWVAHKIASAPTSPAGLPDNPVIIKKIERLNMKLR